MNGYVIDLSCLKCGSDCEPVTEGRAIAGAEANAIARCTWCRSEWEVHVRLLAVRVAPDSSQHGTPTSYVRHYRRGEQACDICKDAHDAARKSRGSRRVLAEAK